MAKFNQSQGETKYIAAWYDNDYRLKEFTIKNV